MKKNLSFFVLTFEIAAIVSLHAIKLNDKRNSVLVQEKNSEKKVLNSEDVRFAPKYFSSSMEAVHIK